MVKFKKYFRNFLILLFFIIFVFLIFLICNNQYMKNISNSKIYYDRGIDIIPTADYIVVPGAKINMSNPSEYLEHRLIHAYSLYEAGKAPKIIISGGFDEESSKYETEVMHNYLINLGVKEEDIISDLQGNSTYETLVRVKEFVKDKSVIFCTQELYSYRAIYIAKKIDLDLNVFCADSVIYSHNIRNYVRETFSKVKAVLDCNFSFTKVNSLESYPFYF